MKFSANYSRFMSEKLAILHKNSSRESKYFQIMSDFDGRKQPLQNTKLICLKMLHPIKCRLWPGTQVNFKGNTPKM